MKSALPLPFEAYLPRLYADNSTPGEVAIAAKADGAAGALPQSMGDAALPKWQWEVFFMSSLIDPARVPSQFLDEMGYELGAMILPGDSATTKRQKCAAASTSIRHKGIWASNVKPVIDAYTGYSSAIYTFTSSATTWILMGNSDDAPGVAWGTLAGDSTPGLGMDLTGDGTDVSTPGVIWIDVGTNALTAEQITNLKALIVRMCPCYYRVILGYTTTGVFTPYANGQIG